MTCDVSPSSVRDLETHCKGFNRATVTCCTYPNAGNAVRASRARDLLGLLLRRRASDGVVANANRRRQGRALGAVHRAVATRDLLVGRRPWRTVETRRTRAVAVRSTQSRCTAEPATGTRSRRAVDAVLAGGTRHGGVACRRRRSHSQFPGQCGYRGPTADRAVHRIVATSLLRRRRRPWDAEVARGAWATATAR